MKYTNDVEILQYSGYSQNKDRTEENTYNRVKDTTPGNLVPGGAMEDDEDSVRTTITPPTGTIISRWLYVTTVAAGLILVGATIIFIRKRVLVK
ncbi:unknown [Clostridium sp. CAG:269]|nr:unknown [Clostridium sp. CAG:269]